ncbi:MAG: hypothetical protein KatS3mg131_0108 [Candidatus Tectimicrobiota bacterium]|nr:MAG: hypothetical protein KatS3mg131_0108 [Candidatus Tectomicrobia bacterium]
MTQWKGWTPMPAAEVAMDRRLLPDRRQRPTTLWSALRWRGRRRGFRRHGEGQNSFVDCPAPTTVALVLGVIVLSASDALLTLLHLGNGGGEANPLMAFTLNYGHTTFVGLKMAVTCLGAWVLGALQQFVLARFVLYFLIVVYTVIMGMHAAIWLA